MGHGDTFDHKRDGIVVEIAEMRRFMVDAMVAATCSREHAEQLADVLIAGDNRGHYSHGLNRFDMYLRDVSSDITGGSGEPAILNERASTAWVDGKNLLGPVVGNYCMRLAIKKAKETGCATVSAKGSNHYGIAGYYSLLAMREGLIGFTATNTSPLMFPTRAGKVALGTNPFSLAAPSANNNDGYVLDMATTTVALGKVEIASRRGEATVPRGWIADKNGVETQNPQDALGTSGGGLLPLGGSEETGGYKGYGLNMGVEMMCGILADGSWGPHVRRWLSTEREANLGQVFMAWDPEAFAPGFVDRNQQLIDTMRNLPPSEVDKPVLIAGDPERKHQTLCDELGGIPYHPNQIENAKLTAKKFGVKELQTKGK